MGKVRVRKQFEFNEDELTGEAERFLVSRGATYSPPIARTIIKGLRESLLEGIRAGERASDLKRRVRRLLEDQAPSRISRIVRTEVLGAMNAGAVARYRASGVVEQKKWLTARDGNVRPAKGDSRAWDHRAADGQIVPVDSTFVVSGERLAFPGDPSGSPQNIINCRCTVIPVLRGALDKSR